MKEFEGQQLTRTREILRHFQPVRVTEEERDSITNPREAMIVFNTTTSKLNFYNGSLWEEITSS